MADEEWYWCLEHGTAVTVDDPCPPARRLGPYPSREAAEHWKERVEERNEKWEAEDREWNGDDD